MTTLDEIELLLDVLLPCRCDPENLGMCSRCELDTAIDLVLADAARYHQMKVEADKEDSTHRIYMEVPTGEWDAALDAALATEQPHEHL